jgi:hypothetical protein
MGVAGGDDGLRKTEAAAGVVVVALFRLPGGTMGSQTRISIKFPTSSRRGGRLTVSSNDFVSDEELMADRSGGMLSVVALLRCLDFNTFVLNEATEALPEDAF